MSAFMVPVEHIRGMVNAGLQVQYGPMSWPTRALTDEEQTRAYQQGQPWGPQASQVWTTVWRELTPSTAEAVGAMLLAQNRHSVNFRYAEEELEDVYTHGPSRTREPVEVLKAIDCFEYQSCETPDWEQTEAHSFCQTLRRQMIHQLPGYDEADTWPIEEP